MEEVEEKKVDFVKEVQQQKVDLVTYILYKHGGPCTPEELSKKIVLFPITDAELLDFCVRPNSQLLKLNDGRMYVTSNYSQTMGKATLGGFLTTVKHLQLNEVKAIMNPGAQRIEPMLPNSGSTHGHEREIDPMMQAAAVKLEDVKHENENLTMDRLEEINLDTAEDRVGAGDTPGVVDGCINGTVGCLVVSHEEKLEAKPSMKNGNNVDLDKFIIPPEKCEWDSLLKGGVGVVAPPIKLVGPPDAQQKQKHQELKIVPEFENYTIIGEMGSGGYGTVYKVLRRKDEKIFAMKCPLSKTHPSCVSNERTMLKVFGGKNFVIKFEDVVTGRYKSESEPGGYCRCQCILLELVEHDKPEILKKEITIEELQNYFYCLFRALAHLHKNKIMHLDVKPGNFLFSRSNKLGYLVDFNLARDETSRPSKRLKKLRITAVLEKNDAKRAAKRPLLQEEAASSPLNLSKRSRLLMDACLSSSSPSPAKTPAVLQDQSNKKIAHSVTAELKTSFARITHDAKPKSSSIMAANTSSLKPVESPRASNQIMDIGASQQAHVSDSTRENNQAQTPRPQIGHPAILKYMRANNIRPDNVYNHQPPVPSVPQSGRKRVVAALNNRKKLVTGEIPRDLRQEAQASNIRQIKALIPPKVRGVGHAVKDGPCVGTKGYRAPEVLLMSFKQTTKVDIWSAGVSLLQLVTGRSPFPSTSTDGALKDIAKMRGSDKLWRLAAKHNRHHSLSKESRSVTFEPVTIKDWIEKYSKRPDMKSKIPASLVDLLEKCLEIDPDSRITAEDALRHNFFNDVCEPAIHPC